MHLPPEQSKGRNEQDDLNNQMLPNEEEMNFATLAHISGCAGLLGFGYIGFVGPLLIWWLKKDSSSYVEFQAKEAFNFQITILIIAIFCGMVVLFSCGTLFPFLFLPMVLQLVFGIFSVIEVRKGSPYRYPFNLRLMQ